MCCSFDNNTDRSGDLTFWYTDNNKISTVNSAAIFGSPNIFGTVVLQTITGVITSNRELDSLQIGNFTEMKTCVSSTSTSAFVSNTETFFFKNGCIQIQPVGVQPYNIQGNYGLPPNNTYTFKILNSTGDFLNLGGCAVIRTFENLDRLVNIYFQPL